MEYAAVQFWMVSDRFIPRETNRPKICRATQRGGISSGPTTSDDWPNGEGNAVEGRRGTIAPPPVAGAIVVGTGTADVSTGPFGSKAGWEPARFGAFVTIP
jgi:hypothetical protein